MRYGGSEGIYGGSGQRFGTVTGISLTGGTITGTNVPYVLSKSGIPFISLSSGSVSAVGAITGITALPSAYPDAFCWFPANALATAIAAGWYYCTFSTTTAGTAFLNTYTSGTPAIPTSPTAVTDGKGAYTGNATTITGPTISVAAGLLGTKGFLRSDVDMGATNSAGTKVLVIKYGATVYSTANSVTTQIYQTTITKIQNAGGAAKQRGRSFAPTQNSIATGSVIYSAENSATALNWTAGLTMNTATDNGIIEQYILEVQSDGT